MAKLFIGLAIAVILGAAVLSFLTKAEADKLQANLKQTKGILANTENKLKKTEDELTKTKEELADAKKDIEQKIVEIAGLKKDKDDLTMQVTEAKTALEAKVAELAVAEAKVKEIMGAGGGEKVDVAAIKAQIEQTKADLAKAQADYQEQKQLAETMSRNKAEADEKLATANKEIERYRAGVTKAGLTGKILAVNPGWNFVVLSVGDRQGAATGGVMIVTRGGEPIGRVRITSIEPSTSIADIVPGSVRRGVTVQPGDAVVYEGPRSKPSPAAAAGPAGAVGVPPVGNN